MNGEGEREGKIQEYKDRYRFWTDKRISQLSFHNNLLLTVGIAIIGFFWKERHSVYKKLIIDFNSSVDWKVVIFFFGIGALALSIISGFLSSLSRLYDLRLTSNIVLTRRRYGEKRAKCPGALRLKDEPRSKTGCWASIKSLCQVFWCYEKKYEITEERIKNVENDGSKFQELQDTFTQLRQKSRDLGTCTWKLLKYQTSCMLISIIVLIIVLFMK